MPNLRIITDSACDISLDRLKEWDVDVINLSFAFADETPDADISIDEFYSRMKAGAVAKTSAANPETFLNVFKRALEQGNDVLYLAFSSGLSTTCNSARIAADELSEQYPDRKIAVVDSLCASAGQGLFVYLVSKKRSGGADLVELVDYAEGLKLNICHWFTVDDLVYLKRGGRVSPTVAFVGGMLGIKPVMHVDNDGHLVNVTKVRGRKAAIQALADNFAKTVLDKSGDIFISHGACVEDAELLSDIIVQSCGAKVSLITDIGPVIGAHSGPGTLALFFVGSER